MQSNLYRKMEKSLYPFSKEHYERLKGLNETIVFNEGKEDEYIFVPIWKDDEFHITSVSREDFKAKGWDASKVSDEKMQWIADKMSDNYVGNGEFWDDIDFYAEELGLSKIENYEYEC